MTLDGHAARFLTMLSAAESADGRNRSAAAYRSAFRRLSAFSIAPNKQVCCARDDALPGRAGPIPVRLYTPLDAGAAPLPALVYFHGGGWIAGGLQSHDSLCRFLAQASGCVVAAVDYRLAPEHAFPAGFDDCCDALLAFASRAQDYGARADAIAAGGDSAGANFAIGACRFARARGVAPARQLLLCPVIDPFGDWPSRRAFGAGYLLEESAMADYSRLYGASIDPADPRVSPLRAPDLKDLPPADVHTAEFDPVRDEGKAYADALACAGVSVRYTCHAGMIHHFYGLTAVIPAARQALAAIGRGLGEALRAPSPA